MLFYFQFILLYFISHVPTVVVACGKEFILMWMVSARQFMENCWGNFPSQTTGRLDHRSFRWQQQKSWNSRKLLLG